jgi:diguanylate cyclase (GGDEF)-like protein
VAEPMRLHSGSGLMVGGMLALPLNSSRPRGQRLLRALRYWWKQQHAFHIEDEVVTGGRSRVSIRLVLPVVSPVLAVLAVLVWREPENQVAFISLVYATSAILFALAAEAVDQRLSEPFWMQAASVIVYAAIITALLLTFVTFPHPRLHTHWIVFFLYFLLIGATGLFDDPRQPIVAGFISVLGYFGVVLLLHHAARAGSPMAISLSPEFEWVANASKLGLIIAATFLATTSASRGRQLRRTSLSDGLTGLLNRHAFDQCLGSVARRANRSGCRMTVAMVDIDDFKQINDNYGHVVGDAVLRWMASWLKRSFRSSDLVARYGGEEFVVAFPDSDYEQIEDRLEVLRRGIECSVLRRDVDGPEIKLTISIGTARMPEDGEDPEAVLARADERLYQAKRMGRNRIVSGGPRESSAAQGEDPHSTE